MSITPEQFDFKFSDPENLEFARVSESIATGKKLIAIYGEAGTGKSTFIRELTSYCGAKQIGVQCLAFTGRAAGSIAGRTFHSYFRFELRPYLPTEAMFEWPTAGQLREQGLDVLVKNDAGEGVGIRSHLNLFIQFSEADLMRLDMLIIDEISMVRCDLLDACDIIMRKVKGNDEPFGGLVVLFVGDKRQLPPVANASDSAVLKDHYAEPFGYLQSDVIRRTDLEEVLLNNVYRQKDPGFIALLRGIRLNGLMPADIETLNKRLDPAFKFERIPVGHQIICSTNKRVDHYNQRMLDLIGSNEYSYKAEVSAGYPPSDYPTNLQLRLKLGAKIMFLQNDSARRFYNGTTGQVRALFDDRVVVEVNNQEIEVMRYRWTYETYLHDKDERVVKSVGKSEYFFQIPLRLAWAMTTHKAQGQTFDGILCDLSDEFMPEHTYVTLSRCRSLEGITMLAPLESTQK